MTNPWIQTASGQVYDLVDPDPNVLTIVDVAHALARICRFTGHVLGNPYSVAQHSVNVARVLRDEGHSEAIQREGLMHDAHESMIGDVASPVKKCLGDAWKALEERHEGVFRRRFSLAREMPEAVHRADLRMLMTECRDLLGGESRSWGIYAEPYDLCVMPWDAIEAERTFLSEARLLGVL